jgi:hypothetical protein
MTLAQALLTEAATVGLTIRRRGNRLALVAPTPPPADLVERLRQAKPALLAALPDEDDPADPPFIAPDGTDDGPHEPCPKCGGRNFWRPSMTTKAWRCRQCVPPLPTIWADGVFLPPAATTKGHQNVRS